MPSFVYPALLTGMALAALPVLIHLINMLRHRRVRWAAMEFLEVSQKRNRTWVLLKQLLLMAARVAIIAAIVLVVAQPVLENEVGSLFGGTKTHHIVLLDDSFSMSDRWADTSAFAEAQRVVARIGAEAARQAQAQTFTLLRFSRTAVGTLGTQPDLQDEPVDREFAERLRQTLDAMEPSELAAGPLAALEAIDQLLGDEAGQQRIVYLISDFRAREWSRPEALRTRLVDINKHGAALHLVNCVEAARPNLALTELSPRPGTLAAGVPLFMEIGVQNFGAAPVKDVNILLAADDLPRPAVQIAEIPPGKVVRQQFPVHFPLAGEHRLTARLETDAVAVDNFRYSVVELPATVPVLVIDGGAEALDARYLTAALAPGSPVETGLSPRIEKPRWLALNQLDSFASIYLLNIERLDDSAIAALEEYVAAGGGLAIFLGPASSSKFINEQLYRDGRGLFPLPLAGEAELAIDRLVKTPDIEVTPHPVFRVLAGARNDFLATVNVRRYFAAPKDWQPPENGAVDVIARLRNGAPFCVERALGKGRVVAFLSTAAPTWNNWARGNPSYVVAMLELQAFLARRAESAAGQVVGAPLEVRLEPSEYEPQVRFATPQKNALPLGMTTAAAGPDGQLAATLAETGASGIYQINLIRKDGGQELRQRAFNVDAAEGNLKTVSGEELAGQLAGVRYDYHPAALFEHVSEELAGYNLAQPLLYLLLAMLIGEQVLAWSASYHTSARRPARGGAA